jgi:hypothetical protein
VGINSTLGRYGFEDPAIRDELIATFVPGLAHQQMQPFAEDGAGQAKA